MSQPNSNEESDDLAHLLKMHLDERLFTAEEIALYLGVSNSAISNWKSGKTKIRQKHFSAMREFMEAKQRERASLEFNGYFLEPAINQGTILDSEEIEFTTLMHCVVEKRRKDGKGTNISDPETYQEVVREIKRYRYKLRQMFGLEASDWLFLEEYFKCFNKESAKAEFLLAKAIDRYNDSKLTDEDQAEMETRLSHNGLDLRDDEAEN